MNKCQIFKRVINILCLSFLFANLAFASEETLNYSVEAIGKASCEKGFTCKTNFIGMTDTTRQEYFATIDAIGNANDKCLDVSDSKGYKIISRDLILDSIKTELLDCETGPTFDGGGYAAITVVECYAHAKATCLIKYVKR